MLRTEQQEKEQAYLNAKQAPGRWSDEEKIAPDYYANAGIAAQEMSPEACIDFLFTFHNNPDKTPHYVEIREAAKAFAKVIVRHTPGGQDRVTAINKLREVVMFANACIALGGHSF